MTKWIETIGYRLCWRGDWVTRIVAPIFFRWRCPHPIIADHSVKACIAAGVCGCNNGDLGERSVDR